MHPDRPGAYLAGVECDGAAYHRSAAARDRDKTRQQVLENLGWHVLRVWSTDWWYDPSTAIDRLHADLNEQLQRTRNETPDQGPCVRPEEPLSAAFEEEVDAMQEEIDSTEPTDLATDCWQTVGADDDSSGLAVRPQLVAKQSPRRERLFYKPADLGDAAANQNRFFDEDYSDNLRRMASSVLESQGPIRDDALVREVARAHGFARTGNRIKQRILDLLPDVTVTEESVGRFLWPGASASESIPFRYPASDVGRRSLDEVALPELVSLVRELSHLAATDDPALALAREIGLARLSRTGRERLEEALESCNKELQN